MQGQKLTPGEWKEVQDFVEKTGDIPLAAREFGITANSIHQRAFRCKWKTPKKVAAAMLEEESRKMAQAMTQEQAIQIVKNGAEETLTTIASRLSTLREEMPVTIAEGVAAKLKSALTTLPDPKGWKEFASGVNILASMLGLNRQVGAGVNIQFNGMAWGSSPSPENAPKPIIVVQEG